jgi:hypothetical protein
LEASRDCPAIATCPRSNAILRAQNKLPSYWFLGDDLVVSSYLCPGSAAVSIRMWRNDCAQPAYCRVVAALSHGWDAPVQELIVLPPDATSHTHPTQPSISTASIPGPSTFSKHVYDGLTHPPCPPVVPLARTAARGLCVHRSPCGRDTLDNASA